MEQTCSVCTNKRGHVPPRFVGKGFTLTYFLLYSRGLKSTVGAMAMFSLLYLAQVHEEENLNQLFIDTGIFRFICIYYYFKEDLCKTD